MSAPGWGPPAVRRVAAAVAVEGGLLTLAGLAFGLAILLGRPEDPLTASLAAALGVITGVGLVLLARALGRVRAWSRSPVLVLQILALPVGLGLAQAGLWLPAVVVVGLAVGVLGLLAVPPCRLAFRRG